MKKLLLLFCMAIATTIFAQNQINLVQGNFDFLKDQTEVNVQLKFDNAVYQEKNLTEEQYLEGRKTDIITRKGEKVWDNWAFQWGNFKTSEYLEYFFKGINPKLKKIIAFRNDVKAKYTLIIDAKWIYAGWYGGMIGSQEAKLTADLLFVETDSPDKVVMKLSADKILGRKENKIFNWEYGRIAAAYEITGRKLGVEIKKALKN